jgi:cytochrome c biogenesis protein CcdA/peroxiredoxin
MDISGLAQSLAEALKSALATGSFAAYLIVFLAGVVASLTPCVYPMIPITISIIGGRTKKGPFEGFLLSVTYALGIATTYALIGVVFASLRRFAGQQIGVDVLSNSPWVSAGVSVICVLFAMVMLDKLSIPMPAKMQAWQSRRKGSGYVGAYFAGLLFGTVASPCLAPVVGLIAIEIAKTGRILYGGTMLFTFGLGLGVLFIVIGTFAGATSALPKAGAWMDRIKGFFAWLMLAIALAYMFQAGKLAMQAKLSEVERSQPRATVDAGKLAPPYEVPPDAKIVALPIDAALGTPASEAPLAGGKLSDLWQDKTLVLVFFAPWCKNCPKEIPDANELAKKMPDAVRVLGVGATVAGAASQVWAKDHGVEYDLIFDPDGALLAAYHPEETSGLPWVVVISRGGELLYRDVSWPKNIEELVEKGFAATPARPAAVAGSADSAKPELAEATTVPAASGDKGPYEVVADETLGLAGEVGTVAPDVSLKSGDGAELKLSSFWADGGVLLCLFGRAGAEDTRGLAEVEKLAGALGSGLTVLEVTGAPTLAEAAVWAKENGAKQGLLTDPTHELPRLFGGESATIPWYVFLGKGGKLLYSGPWPANAEELGRSAAGGA